MTAAETTFQTVSELAYEVAGLLLNEEEGDPNTELLDLAAELECLALLDEKHLEALARGARRAPFDVPLWLRGTAVLCRLVRANMEEPEELIERLFSLHWSWRELPDEPRPLLAADDVALLWRDINPNSISVPRELLGLPG